MNNYLSNIAARALNQAPTVRPRLRGRFDPGPANEPAVDRLKLALPESIASEPPVENSLAATSENQRAHEHLHARQGPDDENEPHNLSFAHRDEKKTFALQDDTPIPPPQTPVVQVPIATPTVPTAQPARVSVNPLAPIASSVERDASSTRAEERRLLEARPDQARPSDQREIKTIIVREERIIEHSAQAREPGSHSTPASALPSSNQPRRGDTKLPPVVVQTRIAPLVEKGLDAFSLSRPSPQPQPTVRVTIGRIEVRAVGSSESPAKPRATPPVMNLDDYLRRRNQGSSR